MEAEMEPVMQPICANLYLNAVFSYYIQKFQDLSVKLNLDIRVGDEMLPYMELCRILSNGLENAWEASAALGGEMFAYTDCGNFVLDVMVRTKKFPVQSNE